MVDHKRPAPGAAPKFSFGVWLRLHGVDLITMALMGALGLGIYEAPPAPSRSFPVYFQSGDIVYPEFSYPLRKARRRSLNDLLTTTMGLLKSLITAAVFQVWIKWLIGGLRPHFYEVCQPRLDPSAAPSGNGFHAIMYDRTICTGDKDQIDDSLESMPSGHSTAAWAGLFFLALYFNAQLKVMSAHNPAYWKMILMFCPLLGATLIAGALTIDEFHNWYDVVAGAIIGISTATVAFRSTFAAVLDFRFNHVLIPRTTSIFHRKPYFAPGTSQTSQYPFFSYQPSQEFGSADLPFTREGGWGWGQEAFVVKGVRIGKETLVQGNFEVDMRQS
ncbi:hypothetical protein V5O48_003548 [Marasmius crinis-equi]|uniref:Phosphatidic acid phosphatase type 2/haloperoxidase domain-containing protein n=1 Tax=Marasmius crinis-equi TaxID=585013 RepID=A0ABR3FTK3_9AGAR